MREERDNNKLFAVIKDSYKTEEDRENRKNGWPKFFIGDNEYSMVSGLIKSVDTEKKKITPRSGTNAGVEITIKNLIVSIVDQEGEFDLQIPLYSALSRNVMNALAGPNPFEEVFFSVYNNKNGFRSITLRNSKEKEDYLVPYYTWEQEMEMVETKIDKGEEKKDFDKLTDKYIKELIPIINKKISSGIEFEKGAVVPSGDTQGKPMPSDEVDDDLPF